MKQCNKCNQLLDESEFEMRNDTGKLRGQCKECRRKQKRKYDKLNKNRLQENNSFEGKPVCIFKRQRYENRLWSYWQRLCSKPN